MKTYKIIFIVANLLLLLVYFNYSVSQKEQILKNGQLILLELAPVDPRSLMQGDYMALNYAIGQDVAYLDVPKRGYCVVKLDDQGVAHSVRFQTEKTPLQASELLIAYSRPQNWQINIGAESFFFEEGTAEKYESAKYGGLRIDAEGNSLLIGLYDKNRKQIQ